MNIFNSLKEKRLIEKNLFFIGTIFIMAVNISVFFFFNKPKFSGTTNNWNKVLDFSNLSLTFTSAFYHSNLQHVLLNSLCFLVVGAYVERKQGTLGLLVLVFVFALFGESMIDANHKGTSVGFSGVNFAFYAYVIVDFIFTIKQLKREKCELLLSIIVLCLIYVACCFCGGTSEFSFKIYPYDLIHNMAHYTGFITGIILTTLIKLSKIYK